MTDSILPSEEWRPEPDGAFALCPLIGADAKIMDRGGMGYLLLYYRSRSHEKAVLAGTEEIGRIQLHLTAAQCRKEAERLLLAADKIEGVGVSRN